MPGKVRTGIRKDKTFCENLDAVYASIRIHGYYSVSERLEEMKKFWWIQHTDDQPCNCLICEIQESLDLADIPAPTPKPRISEIFPAQPETDQEWITKW